MVITTDQGTQFESELFQGLTKLIGAHRIHTTPYHPSGNGMVERWHRTLKSAFMCSPETPWPDLLPAALLGLRTAYKEDIGCSAAELLFGCTLRLPGDFFEPEKIKSDVKEIKESVQRHFAKLTPSPSSNHSSIKPFVSKDLNTCTHVFRRDDQVRKSLTPPYSGPHRVVERIDDKRFKVDVNGVIKTLSVDSLKPAYTAQEDEIDSPATTKDKPKAPLKKVRFSLPSPGGEAAGKGVPVAALPADKRVTRSMTKQSQAARGITK